MSFIQFESAREKEKMRQELRDAREELLLKAKKSAEQRAQRQTQQDLKGETNWMLPTVAQKIEKLNKTAKPSRKRSKKKKCKKKESKKHKKKRHQSSTSDDSESDESSAEEAKKRKKSKTRSRKRSTSSSNSSPSPSTSRKTKRKHKKFSESSSTESGPEEPDEWVESASAVPQAAPQRDSWMTDSEALSLKTFSRERVEKKPNEKLQINTYDPTKSGRELNPYWKTTGTGLPSFQKPRDDSDDEPNNKPSKHLSKSVGLKSWRKTSSEIPAKAIQAEYKNTVKSNRSSSESSSDSHSESERPEPPNAASFLTDQQMNELGAKILKAEILGNMELAQGLRQKLENARSTRETIKERKQLQPQKKHRKPSEDEEHILLTHTDERGNTRPLAQSKAVVDPRDLYGGRKGKKQQKRLETHEAGERVRYFADDDKYDIKQMFEREKYSTAADSNLQFANIVSKHKNPKDDLEDIFADKIRKNISREETEKKEISRAINEQQKLSSQLENCDKCIDSAKMDKKLIVCVGEKVYLALPWNIGLQTGHCIIVPTMHVSCATQLDEDTWEEIKDFRKALTRMFGAQRKDVVFYEIANKLHRKPHLAIHCIPIDASKAEMAPFYFKKAIEESEHEWSVNKQLVSLRNKDLRSAIPKGLPYFWVNFGMDSGFAHVIEDQERFPVNFAQEIIGGMLNLEPHKWRRPQKEQNVIAKVKMFADWWKKYDCTN